jgi:hypothetical protein
VTTQDRARLYEATAAAIAALSAGTRAQLAAIWAAIQAIEQGLLDGWPALTPGQRRHALLTVQSRVTVLTGQARAAAAAVPGQVRGAYDLGAQAVALSAGRGAAYTAADVTAADVLAADTYADVLTATTHIMETTKELIRTLAKDRIGDQVTTGQTTEQAARQLARDLTGREIAAITYRDGARHGLGDYTDMLVRTKSAEAYQRAGFAQGRAMGVTWWEVMDGPGCGWTTHTDPLLANGRIITTDEAEQYPTSHPRCRRVTTPRADLQSAADAARAAPVGPQHTPEDIAAAQAAAVKGGRTLDRRAGRRPDGTLTTSGAPSAAAARHAQRAARAARRGVPRPS